MNHIHKIKLERLLSRFSNMENLGLHAIYIWNSFEVEKKFKI